MMKTAPKEITVALLEVVVMPNGEIICAGKSVGWVDKIGKYLTVKEQPSVAELKQKQLEFDRAVRQAQAPATRRQRD